MTARNQITAAASDVNARLTNLLSERVGALLEREGCSERELEKSVWAAVLEIGRELLGACLALACWRATQRATEGRSVRLRLDEDYVLARSTTFGPVNVMLFAYREGGATRCPARQALFPMHPKCRSSVHPRRSQVVGVVHTAEQQGVEVRVQIQALVESELFGHRKGAFTGAVTDRQGWLARCPRGGAVFLDEIVELGPMLQVKLLRVLDDRTFSAVGDEAVQRFEGKILAATNRDLPAEIGAGTFRQDLYFRLRGDRIDMPTLRERLDDDPAALGRILRVLVGRMVPEPHAEAVARDVEAEIARARGPRWPWPGNVRELAQCARNVLVQGSCGPAEPLPGAHGGGGPFADLQQGQLSLAEVARRHTRSVYERTRTYKAAAEVLGVDWRTVHAHVESPDS